MQVRATLLDDILRVDHTFFKQTEILGAGRGLGVQLGNPTGLHADEVVDLLSESISLFLVGCVREISDALKYMT